jgi:hypothetical protein
MMEDYYVTFYVQFQADSEENAAARADAIARNVARVERVDEAVVVAVGRTPRPDAGGISDVS